MDWLTLLARVILALGFLTAALAKLTGRKDWRQALMSSLPERLAAPMVLLMPFAELATVALLVSNASARWGAISALGILGLVTAINGSGSRTISRTTPLRNGLLAAAAVIVLWGGGATPDIASTVADAGFTPAASIGLAVGFGALVLALIEAWIILNLLPQHGRILLEMEKVQRALGIAPDVIYHPTSSETVEAMLRVANVTAADTVYDLGCGDGRIVIAAAERGAHAVGVDIDPVRIYGARANAEVEREKVGDRVQFLIHSLFDVDIRSATVVTIYLSNEINEKLRPKLLRSLPPGSRVVSHSFLMGDWQPDDQVEEHRVHLWVIPADVGGGWTWHLPDGGRATAELQQTYQQVSGRAVVGRETIPISSVRLVGDTITFVLRRGGKELTYRGRVREDSICGAVHDGSGGDQEWSARRISRLAERATGLQHAPPGEQREGDDQPTQAR
jgi:SAM-dependent methyltransferase